MRLRGDHFTNLKISKELMKQISFNTKEEYEDIAFNLITTLESRIEPKHIINYRGQAFGLHRVITYPKTKVKAKCKVVFIVERQSDPQTIQGVNIEIIPQTGQWMKFDRHNLDDFCRKHLQKIVEDSLLSSEVPSPPQKD